MKANVESSSEGSESLKAKINEKLIKLETEYNAMLNKPGIIYIDENSIN